MTVGFCAVELLGVPPGNCQLKLALLGEEVLVNITVRGWQPVVGDAVNPAVGGVEIVTVWMEVSAPQGPVAINTTV